MKDVYDLVLIGGGVSSCTLIFNLLKNGFKGRIGVVEAGRGLGGRCSTRRRQNKENLAINHGSPIFNITNTLKNPLLNSFISQLLENNLIKKSENSFYEVDNSFNLSNLTYKHNYNFYFGNVYQPNILMSELLENLVSFYNSNDQIDFYFKKLIVKLNYENNIWRISSNKDFEIFGKLLISTSNLILHKRSLNILNVNQIPLIDALKNSNNTYIDEIISLTNNQEYIKRVNFIIYPKSNFYMDGIFDKDNIHFIFNNNLEKNIGIERIIFQKQIDNTFCIVVHTKNREIFQKEIIKDDNKFLYEYLFKNLDKILKRNSVSTRNFSIDDISIMNWRASQPIGKAIPARLQFCKDYKIGFCGDWFEFEGYGTVQGAFISALTLSEKISKFI